MSDVSLTGIYEEMEIEEVEGEYIDVGDEYEDGKCHRAATTAAICSCSPGEDDIYSDVYSSKTYSTPATRYLLHTLMYPQPCLMLV